jgi:hypothetical protein
LRDGSKRVVPDKIYSAVLRADRVVRVQVRLHVRVRGPAAVVENVRGQVYLHIRVQIRLHARVRDLAAVAVVANVRRNGEHAQEVTDGQETE